MTSLCRLGSSSLCGLRLCYARQLLGDELPPPVSLHIHTGCPNLTAEVFPVVEEPFVYRPIRYDSRLSVHSDLHILGFDGTHLEGAGLAVSHYLRLGLDLAGRGNIDQVIAHNLVELCEVALHESLETLAVHLAHLLLSTATHSLPPVSHLTESKRRAFADSCLASGVPEGGAWPLMSLVETMNRIAKTTLGI